MNIQEKLMLIQQELVCSKNQLNKFGGYNYRSLEDIMEAVKPLLKNVGANLVVSDTMISIGDRVYVEATAKITDVESGEYVIAKANAREALTQKGMQDSQLTGSTSSYARKYCLNGLFCIDDTKDADTMKPPKDEESFISKMAGYAKLNNDEYWVVMNENKFKTAHDVKDVKVQQKIVKAIDDLINKNKAK